MTEATTIWEMKTVKCLQLLVIATQTTLLNRVREGDGHTVGRMLYKEILEWGWIAVYLVDLQRLKQTIINNVVRNSEA